MATPRRPYVSLRLGIFDDVLAAGVSAAGALLLARLLTHRDKRSIPGLLRRGPAAIAESLKLPPAPTKRALAELERAGCIMIDAAESLLYCSGAIEMDPPKTENSLRGMAAQCRELPAASPVTLEVQHAVASSLAGSDKGEAWMPIWRDLSTPSAGPGPGLGAGPGGGPLRDPMAASDGREPPPPPADSETAAAFRMAWGRLPAPFAAAAAEDFTEAAKIYDLESFDALVMSLACSKWVTGEGGLNIVPTLRALLAKPPYASRIIRGEFESRGARWVCPDCDVAHASTVDCPTPCRACMRAHPFGYVCPLERGFDGHESRGVM